jgi:antitoxin (DNA-binding transcriptional repressor) of toxin-antitoxin stability system
MNAVTLSEAQQHLVELFHDLAPQGELLITDNNRPVARLLAVTSTAGRASLRDLKPASVGAVLQPFPSPEDDTLAEMLAVRK